MQGLETDIQGWESVGTRLSAWKRLEIMTRPKTVCHFLVECRTPKLENSVTLRYGMALGHSPPRVSTRLMRRQNLER